MWSISFLLKIDGFFNFNLPGLGVTLTLFLILGLGMIGSNLITKRLLGVFEVIFGRLPLIKVFYFAVRDLVNAFAGEKKGFNHPVLVSLWPEGETQALGFMTRASFDDLGIQDRVGVYFPQAFNFAGNLLLVPSSAVTPLDANAKDIMSLIVSGGISSPARGAESQDGPRSRATGPRPSPVGEADAEPTVAEGRPNVSATRGRVGRPRARAVQEPGPRDGRGPAGRPLGLAGGSAPGLAQRRRSHRCSPIRRVGLQGERPAGSLARGALRRLGDPSGRSGPRGARRPG